MGKKKKAIEELEFKRINKSSIFKIYHGEINTDFYTLKYIFGEPNYLSDINDGFEWPIKFIIDNKEIIIHNVNNSHTRENYRNSIVWKISGHAGDDSNILVKRIYKIIKKYKEEQNKNYKSKYEFLNE